LTIEEEINFIYISTDDVKFKQILLNLISNSVKFTNSGLIEIEAKYEENELNLNKNVEIIIKDTGVGINTNYQDKLFQDYENINIYTFKKFHDKFGTGLGLSISKKFADQLGIDLIYDSNYNEGTRFIIRIPFEKYQISKEILIIDHDKNKYTNKKNTSFDNYIINDSSSTIKYINDQITNNTSNFYINKKVKLNKNCSMNSSNYKINCKKNCYNKDSKDSNYSLTEKQFHSSNCKSSLKNKMTTDSSDSQRNTLNNLSHKKNINLKSIDLSVKDDNSIKKNVYSDSNKISSNINLKSIDLSVKYDNRIKKNVYSDSNKISSNSNINFSPNLNIGVRYNFFKFKINIINNLDKYFF